jgi:flagellar motor switch protein FliM
MSDKVLNQDEIDALLKGVAAGDVETAPKDAAPPFGITAFNFAGQDRVVRGRMAALDIIHDRFVKLLNASFSEALHKAVEITIGSTEIVKFGTVVSKLPMPSSLIIFKMEPLRGTALLAMDASLVYLLTDYYFGGTGQVPVKTEGKDFTSMQERIIRNLVALALRDLEQAWKGAHAVKTGILRVESNPQFAMVISALELAMVVTLRLEIGEAHHELFLCYPYSMLEPIKEKLYAGFMSDQFAVDQHWAIRMREEMQHCSLEISVELGQATIHVEDLMNFALGDVILLDKSHGDPVVASVEGIPKFKGMPGIVKGQQALQVTSMIKAED